jgi:hypothetical protein
VTILRREGRRSDGARLGVDAREAASGHAAVVDVGGAEPSHRGEALVGDPTRLGPNEHHVYFTGADGRELCLVEWLRKKPVAEQFEPSFPLPGAGLELWFDCEQAAPSDCLC